MGLQANHYGVKALASGLAWGWRSGDEMLEVLVTLHMAGGVGQRNFVVCAHIGNWHEVVHSFIFRLGTWGSDMRTWRFLAKHVEDKSVVLCSVLNRTRRVMENASCGVLCVHYV